MDPTFKALIVAFVGGSIFYLVVKGLLYIWPKSGKMGINLKKVYCPKCSEIMPSVRKPNNLRQAFWGGYTCHKCGCEIDKYGNEINTLN